ncbi:MAG: hypothetical protein ABI824_08660, partial [Acidobacteriota bacterium]
MKSGIVSRTLCVLTLATAPFGFGGTVGSPQAPVFFEPNRGQFDPNVRFVGRMSDVPVGLFADGVGFETPARAGGAAGPIRMRFLGMDTKARWAGLLSSPGVSNYLTSTSTVTSVERFQKARMNGVYPGIDVELHGSGAKIEYDFIVHPGADPARIRYKVEGTPVRLDRQGNLLIAAGDYELGNRTPELYQERNGVKTPVQGHFILRGTTVSFAVGAYDKQQTLVIDPVIFAKLLSPTGSFSWASSATTDSAGNVYV